MKKIKIVCLANCRKLSGRCVAGKILGENKWIRPVSNRNTEEISDVEQQYESGHQPQLLDIIELRVKEHRPRLHQSENYLIDNEFQWKKIGKYTDNLDNLLDNPELLWGVGNDRNYSSYEGVNDRIPDYECNNYNQSLYLIKPQSLMIFVRLEGEEFDRPRRKVRIQFKYNNILYRFPVTDPLIESKYLSMHNGSYNLDVKNKYLCVSIGMPYEGYCYKFVAALIEM